MRAAHSTPVIALAGNPNVGKSTVFNALTGSRQHTGNWSGKTVANAYGAMRCGSTPMTLVDLPGTYSLRARSAEERAARDFLASGEADVTILVADATCLERNLILVLQVLEITSRAVLCLNLMDEARRKHIRIDIHALEHALGIPVVPCAARQGRGLPELTRAVRRVLEQGAPARTAAIRYPDGIENAIQRAGLPRAAALDALVQSPPPGLTAEQLDDQITAAAALRAEEIALCCVQVREAACERDRRIDRILLSRRWGVPLMLLLLTAVFYITLSGANVPSAWLSEHLLGLTEPLAAALSALGLPPFAVSLLTDGLWRVLATVVSVMLPPMAIFFPLFTLLEDAGYLPRVAFQLDHAFQRAHACGKQSLTMCLGAKWMRPHRHKAQQTGRTDHKGASRLLLLLATFCPQKSKSGQAPGSEPEKVVHRCTVGLLDSCLLLGGLRLELVDDILDIRDRDRIPHALDLGGGQLGSVDADDLAVHVEQRAAAVARVDGRIGLDISRLYSVALRIRPRADRTVECADDAGRDRLPIAERIADRNHLLADPQRIRIAEHRNADRGARIRGQIVQRNLEDGKIVVLIRAAQLGLIYLVVDKADRQGGCVLYHMVIGNDIQHIVRLLKDDA